MNNGTRSKSRFHDFPPIMIVHKISPLDYETSQIIVALDGKTFRSLKSRPDCRRNATVIKRELSRSLVPFARICRREQRGNVLLSFEKFQLVHLDSTGEISGSTPSTAIIYFMTFCNLHFSLDLEKMKKFLHNVKKKNNNNI